MIGTFCTSNLFFILEIFFFKKAVMIIKSYNSFLLNRKIKKIQSLKITIKKGAKAPRLNQFSTYKVYFVNRELLTPACSHFLIVGLMNDMGRAVKIANETTRIKSVVK